MVHENKSNHVVGVKLDGESTYFWVEVVDQLDSVLHVSAVNGISDSYSLFDSCQVCFLLDVGFGGELPSS